MALPVAHAGLASQPVLVDPFYLAVPAGHSLARKTALATADLAGQTLFLLEEGHCLKDQALEVCHQSGAHEHSYFRASSLETLRQMIGSGNGATLMPWLTVNAPISRAASIRYLPFKDPGPHREIGLVWRKSSPREVFLAKWAKELAGMLEALAKSA